MTFEEDQEAPIQINKEEELERQRERMRLLHSRRQLNFEARKHQIQSLDMRFEDFLNILCI